MRSFTEHMLDSPAIEAMVEPYSPTISPGDLLGKIAAQCDYYATDPHSPFTERRGLLNRAQAYRFEQAKLMMQEQQHN